MEHMEQIYSPSTMCTLRKCLIMAQSPTSLVVACIQMVKLVKGMLLRV